jgi:hypothetical protein
MLDTFLLLESRPVIPELYHISFDGSLEKTWYPQNPAGSEQSHASSTSEPDLPRISCAPTIEQCFQAIYPNVCRYFEKENYPHMDFYVYQPQLKGSERVLTPEDLRKSRFVHDAHMTQEYCILDPVYMKRTMKVTITNTNKSEFMKHRPFADGRFKERWFAPKEVRYEVVERY